MATAAASPALHEQLTMLQQLPEAAGVTTCYLDVDGRARPRLLDCLRAFGVLAQRAARIARSEESATQEAVEHGLMRMRRWLEHDLERSTTRGVVLVTSGADDVLRTVSLPVPLRDQVFVSSRPHLLQLVSVLAAARTFGVALLDGERMRTFEYRMGELTEYPGLIESPAAHRDRQHGWNISGSSAATGYDSARWQPAGSHVDRREAGDAERHLATCAAALAAHLDRHPVDHLLLGGPVPERARLERELPGRHRGIIAGDVSVRVAAPLSEIRDALLETFRDIEERDEDAALAALEQAIQAGTAVLGIDNVRAALDAGRVAELMVWSEADSDAVDAAVQDAERTGAGIRIVRSALPGSAGGIAAIPRY